MCLEISAETVAEAIVKTLSKVAILALILLSPVAAGATVLVLLASTASPMEQSVGVGGVNAAADVAYAQLLLNDWPGRNGLVLLTVDGVDGTYTNDAISSFQQTKTGSFDGRLDAGGPGIQALESDHVVAAGEGAALGAQALFGSTMPPEPEWTVEAPDEQAPTTDPVAPLDVDSTW